MSGENRRRRLRALLQTAKVSLDALDSIDAAFIHESSAKEGGGRSNERLEFLGDSVLGFVVALWLYRHFPDDREGALAKRKAAIVSDAALALTARRLNFSDLVILGAGERSSGGSERASILADALEAFVAALFLECGIDAARTFIETQHIPHVDFSEKVLTDPKTLLQEYTQAHFACTPLYRDEGEGPSHLRRFTSFVSVKGEALGTGTGPSKKAAQQEAAAQALAILQDRT